MSTSSSLDSERLFSDELKKRGEILHDINDIFYHEEESPRSEPSREKSNQIWKISDFMIGRMLGRGKFGIVYLVKEKTTGYVLALKVMEKNRFPDSDSRSHINEELQIHKYLNHPNIVKMFGYFYDDKRIYIMLEYVSNGDMFTYLKNKKKLSETETRRFVFQLTSALKYIHDLKIIHRDLKLENLLLDKDLNLKLADFGWATTEATNTQALCGTLDYLSPEMVYNENYNSKVDMWALGVLTYEFLIGNPPFYSNTYGGTYKKIQEADFEFPNDMDISDDAKDFINSLLVKNTDTRYTAGQALEHPFLTNI
jgi:serine/threonine protein kinase